MALISNAMPPRLAPEKRRAPSSHFLKLIISGGKINVLNCSSDVDSEYVYFI